MYGSAGKVGDQTRTDEARTHVQLLPGVPMVTNIRSATDV